MKTKHFMNNLLAASLAFGILSSCGKFLSRTSNETTQQPLNVNDGWSSGGGAIVADQLNPWFLARNTPVVKYCIQSDESTFGIGEDAAGVAITQAFQYWQNRFAEAKVDYFAPTDVTGWTPIVAEAVELPKFEKVPCANKDVLLTFQLGVLQPEQQKDIGDPTAYIALARRTGYDEVNLRGKGFIYVSPQKGDLAPKNPNIKPDRWSKGQILKLILAHELGHALGFGHSFPSEIMKETMPESIASVDTLLGSQYEPAVFTFKSAMHSWCKGLDSTSDESFMQMFGITKSCYKIDVNKTGFDVTGYSGMDPETELTGHASFSETPSETAVVAFQPGLSIYTTTKQEVFSDLKDLQTHGFGAGSTPLGTWTKTVQKKGVYKSADGKTSFPCTVLLSSQRVIMNCAKDGDIRSVAFSSF